MDVQRPTRVLRWLGPLLVIGLALLLYRGGLAAPFTSDDVVVALQHPGVRNLSNWTTVLASDFDRPLPPGSEVPTGMPSRFGLYRPLLVVSYKLNAILGGVSPFGWRLFNLLLHLCASLLVWSIGRRLLNSETGALAASAAFAAHPIHTEAVITLLGGRAELLATVWVLLGWRLFLAGGEGSGWRRRGFDLGSAGCLVLGLMSKENAAVLPGILALGALALERRPLREVALRLLPCLVALVGFALWRWWVVGRLAVLPHSAVLGDLEPWRLPLVLAGLQATYLRLVLLPWPLQWQTCYENLPAALPVAAGIALLLGFVLLLIGCLVQAVRSARAGRPSPTAWAVLLFFGCLVPVSQLVPFAVVLAERFLYLPSVALCLWLGFLASRAIERPSRIAAGALIGALLLGAYALGTTTRVATWDDLDRLWTETAACAPAAAEPWNNLGTARLREGRAEEALALFERAATLQPDWTRPRYNRALALQQLGRSAETEATYREILSREPEHSLALLNLGALLAERGTRGEAAELFARARRADPSVPEPYVNLAALQQEAGALGEAERLLRTALELDPANAGALFNLGRLLESADRPGLAEAIYRRLIAAHPDHAMGHNNLALLRRAAGDVAAARRGLETALALDPDCGPAHFNLANLLLRLEQNALAARHFERAAQLSPDYLEAWIGLAWARGRLGELEAARRAADRAHALQPDHPRVRELVKMLELPDSPPAPASR